MGLSDIAAETGTITHGQQDRGVGTVDATDGPLVDRLDTVDGNLVCEPAAAATVAEAYAGGASVGDCAREAGLAPITAAKTLHQLGIPGISPLSPAGREILEDWLDGRLTRHEARTLAGATEAEFALATYVQTHQRLESVVPAVERVLASGRTDGTADGVEDRFGR